MKSSDKGVYLVKSDNTKNKLPMRSGTYGSDVVELNQLKEAELFTYDPGFMFTASCTSEITYIDGNSGILLHRGYSISDLCEQCSYIEVIYLLFNKKLPNAEELKAFEKEILDSVESYFEKLKIIINCYPRNAEPTSIMAGVYSYLASLNKQSYNLANSSECYKYAVEAVSLSPVIVSMIYRFMNGLEILPSRTDLSYLENFLYMMFSGTPQENLICPEVIKALNIFMILHADHEQNASTTVVRGICSSGSNFFSAISAGISSLWGPAHGGANEGCLRMLEMIIKDVSDIDKYISKAKDKSDKFRLIGFGHRVYKTFDPRSSILHKAYKDVAKALNIEDSSLYQLVLDIEKIARLDEYFVSRKLYPNIDFYSGIFQKSIGMPISLFCPMFALGRTPGWAAHFMEMIDSKEFKICRPRQLYIGESERMVIGLLDRK